MTDPTRLATPLDGADLDDTLCDAFSTDPFWAWFLADPDRPGFARPDALRTMMVLERIDYAPFGHTYTVPGRAAALWAPPGHRVDLTRFLELFTVHAHPGRLAEAAEQFFWLADAEPDVPHFYLHLIGARDEARGQGLGSALLSRVTAICDHDGIPAYLEASSPRAAALYERHGFVEQSVIEFAPGVALRPMLREPRPPA